MVEERLRGRASDNRWRETLIVRVVALQQYCFVYLKRTQCRV